MKNGVKLVSRCLPRCLSAVSTSSTIKRWSSSTQRTWSTPLAKTIAEAITTTGPISIAAYMRQCLTSPDGGYYTTQTHGHDQFGKHGDFITSPEISQMFGELLGIWTVTEWMAQGKKSRGVELIEVGPGRGTLMDDMLRTIRNFKSLSSSIEAVYLIEASPTLRGTQKQLLCGDASMEETENGYRSTSKYLGLPVTWVEDIRFVPNEMDKSPFIFAHEFFDALPIHAFQAVAPAPSQNPPTIATPTRPVTLRQSTHSTTPQWRELVVSLNPKAMAQNAINEPEFQLSLSKASNPTSLVLPEISDRYKSLKSQPGSVIEISPESHSYAQEFARRIGGDTHSGTQGQSPSGAALILDYGTSSTIPINSLRGIRSHKQVSPLSSPGQVDISADVDFTALAEAALKASPGVEVYGPVEQGDFLQTLGIAERAEQLLRGKHDESRRKILESGWRRLVERGGGAMGKIYKAMAIVPESGGKRRPVGFGGGVGP